MSLRLIDIFKVQETSPQETNQRKPSPLKPSLHLKPSAQLFAWLYDEDAQMNSFLPCVFSPRLYVHSSVRNLVSLQKMLSGYGIASKIEVRKTINGPRTVLGMNTEIAALRDVIKDIDALSRYSYEIYNADIPIEEHYLFVHHMFPTGKVHITQDADGRITSMHPCEENTADFEIPSLSVSRLSIETSYPLRKDLHPDLVAIEFDGMRITRRGGKAHGRTGGKTKENAREHTQRKTQDALIEWFISAFRNKDPDILITQDGNLELPYLLDLIRKVEPSFSFSRFGTDVFSVHGKSYFTYGRMVFKQMPCYLKGRLHFQEHGVMYGAWSLDHPFTLARLCRTTVQRANHRSPGYCASNLQLYHAMKKGFLIPHRRSCVEVWKSGTELFNADRGSLIYEPRVGWHANVAELDFVSLYPNIMVNHNISTETLFCRCCRWNKVPGLGINICTRERGVIPDMLEPLISQRIYYKNQGLASRADALKGVLVTSFGYMGFRKSKFARIEAHQAIQAYAREILLAAAKTAEEHGFTVLHGIVDSLWICKKGAEDAMSRGRADALVGEAAVQRNAKINKEELASLMKEISAKTGIDIKLEGIYRWIVFLPSTQHRSVPVTTRYYGLFDNGELKLRGIECRRHDTPPIISQLQLAILSELAVARTFEEFSSVMNQSRRHVDRLIARLIHGEVAEEELAFTKGLSKDAYQSHIAQGIILSKLRKQGFAPKPGQYIRYIITGKDAAIAENRYGVVGGGINGETAAPQYDRTAYIILAKKAVENLFLPFLDTIGEKQTTVQEAGRARGKRLEKNPAGTSDNQEAALSMKPFPPIL